MALVEIRHISPVTRLGLWRMEESVDELLTQFPHLQSFNVPYTSVIRQKEFLCIRALLYLMTGDASLQIGHAESGRPVVDGWQLSISHTRGYAVLILSESENVAVDIEYRSDRVERIASRYIRPDEACSGLSDMLLIWSAKETLYKLYSDDELQFFEMRSSEKDAATILMENMKRKESVSVSYEHTDAYVLTYVAVRL